MNGIPSDDSFRRAADYLSTRGTDHLGTSPETEAAAAGGSAAPRRRLRTLTGGLVAAAVLAGSGLAAAAITGSLPVLGTDDDAPAREQAAPDPAEGGEATGGDVDSGRAQQADTPADGDDRAAEASAALPGAVRPTGATSGPARTASPPAAGVDESDPVVGPGPVVSDISIPAEVPAGTTLTVSWTVTAPAGLDARGMATSWLIVGGSSGWVGWCPFPLYASWVSGTVTEARFVASCDVPAWAPNGTYGVWIDAADAAGVTTGQQVGAEFTVTQGSKDTAVPVVRLLSAGPAGPTAGGELRPGGELLVRMQVSDETGVSYVVPWIVGANGLPVDEVTILPWGSRSDGVLVSGSSVDGVYEAVIGIGAATPAGTYQLWISVSDTVGNRSYEPMRDASGAIATIRIGGVNPAPR